MNCGVYAPQLVACAADVEPLAQNELSIRLSIWNSALGTFHEALPEWVKNLPNWAPPSWARLAGIDEQASSEENGWIKINQFRLEQNDGKAHRLLQFPISLNPFC